MADLTQSELKAICRVLARYRGVAEEGVPFKEIAGVIGRRLNVPVVSLPRDEAADHFGWFISFAAMDMPASSQRTREGLAWRPNEPGLIADLDQAHYFQADVSSQRPAGTHPESAGAQTHAKARETGCRSPFAAGPP